MWVVIPTAPKMCWRGVAASITKKPCLQLVGHYSVWHAQVLSFVMASAVNQGWFASSRIPFIFMSLTTFGTSAWDDSRGRADIEREVGEHSKREIDV